MANTLRREINPQIRVIDAKKGTVEYIASNAAVDSYGEVIDPSGWQFDRFQKNAPFVDSHNYDSIDCLLGKVVDFRVTGGNLVETVQWAIDVPQNILAQKGFAMTQAGYLKAVSVGFIPTKIVRPSDQTGTWDAAIKDLGLSDLEDSISCIYLEQQQLELSVCCIGANPDAVALKSAYRDGIIEDADLLRWPSVRRAIESTETPSRRTYSFPTTKTTMSKQAFLDSIVAKLRLASSTGPTIQQGADDLEAARRGQSESELFRASAIMRYAMGRRRRITAHERAVEILSDNLVSEFLNALPRYLAGVTPNGPGPAWNNDLVRKSLTPGSGNLGATLLPIDVAMSIFDLILINGAFRELGVVSMPSMQTKFAQATTNPTAYWITPDYMGNPISADTALTGSNVTQEAPTIAVLLPISRELLQDAKANLAFYLLTRFSEALAGAIDYASLQGNGVADTTNGGFTGIWNDNTIATATSAQGNAAISQLAREDFINVVATLTPAALQRECKWIFNPSCIAPLMLLKDPQAKEYLLKTPAETGDGTWRLVGFEVVWAAQAPSVQTPAATIAAFGHLPSYLVGMREELEVMLRDGAGFLSNQQSFRAISRAICQTRAASGLVKFILANG